MLRGVKTAFAVAAVFGSVLLSAPGAVGATAPTGGTITVWDTPSPTGRGGSVVITGAIGDYGKDVNVNASGKVDENGSYTRLVLKKGTILLDGTQFQAALDAASPTDSNTTTCTLTLTANAPAPIVSGTKAYAGITGSLALTATFAVIEPLKKSGECNNDAQPAAFWGSIVGSGTVSFG